MTMYGAKKLKRISCCLMSDKKNLGHNSKKDFLKNPVEHIDITSFDSRKIISSMEKDVFCF